MVNTSKCDLEIGSPSEQPRLFNIIIKFLFLSLDSSKSLTALGLFSSDVEVNQIKAIWRISAKSNK